VSPPSAARAIPTAWSEETAGWPDPAGAAWSPWLGVGLLLGVGSSASSDSGVPSGEDVADALGAELVVPGSDGPPAATATSADPPITMAPPTPAAVNQVFLRMAFSFGPGHPVRVPRYEGWSAAP
jgi:hypothetical protein